MRDLLEENNRLKWENKRLSDLLANLTEQTQKSVDYWRSSYMILAAGLLEKGELNPGEQPEKSRRAQRRNMKGSDARI